MSAIQSIENFYTAYEVIWGAPLESDIAYPDEEGELDGLVEIAIFDNAQNMYGFLEA